uniref:molybdopterin oxidoreductase family protein n=1 Tax=Aliiroseovarius sp. TaxID=1872442 RepID=UPI002624E8AB
RVTEPLIRKDGKLTPVPLEQAVDYVARTAAHIRRNDGHVQGLISARQTNETAFFFQKLMRETFRSGDIHSSSRFPGLRDNQAVDALMQILSAPENRRPLKAALASEVVFLLGANVTEENPVTGFLIREAVRDQDKQLLVTSSRPSGLDDIAHASLRLLPGNEAVLLSALCGDMAQAAPNGMADFISASHASLDKAGSITLIVGSEFLRSSLAAGCLQWILRATDIWKAGGKEVCVHVLTDRANQRGLWEMGALPGAGPGGQPDPALSPPSNAVPDMVYILGADPVDGSPDDNPYRLAALETPCLVVQSSHMTRTAEMAHVVLPAPTYGEESGTYTNNEGLKQRVRIFRASPGVRTCQETLGLIATATETALRSGHAGPVEARFSAVADIPSTGIADFHPTVPNMGGKAGLDSPQVISDRRSGLTRYLVTGDGQFHSGNLLSQSRVLSSIRNGPYVEVNPGEDFNFETDGQMVSLVRGEARFTGRLKVNRAFDEDIVFVPECYLAGSAGNILSFAEYPLRVRLEFS